METFIARVKTGELELLAGGDDFCRRKLRVLQTDEPRRAEDTENEQ